MTLPVVHDNIVFILVRPCFLGNIGAAARVLKNFAFKQLRLVDPPKQYRNAEARRMAVGAFDVLKGSQVCGSLSEALADIAFAVGTSAGQRRSELPPGLPTILPEVLSVAPNNKVAFVFGDERNGLPREELLRCHAVARIPANQSFPSLNMAQAVGIVAYELARDREEVRSQGTDVAEEQRDARAELLPTGLQDDELFEQVGALLDVIEFSRTFNRHQVLRELRQAYQRLRPTTRELDLIRGVLHRLRQRLECS
jgi:tRNA (cytidine32/uridine32-2'-O)-methyltransferase